MSLTKSNKRKRRERHIPTPVKVYLRQFLGEDVLNKPLTEEYFQPEELKAINLLIEESRQKTRKTKRIGRRSDPSRTYSPRSSKASMGFKVPSDWIREDTYDPKGTVTYNDYAQLEKMLEQEDGADFSRALKQSSSAPDVPYQSIKHTLGNFAYEEIKDPDTGEVKYRVTDVYNWDPVYGPYGLKDLYGMKEGGGRYPKWRDLPNIITGRTEDTKIGERAEERFNLSQRLSNLAEWAGGKFGPRESRGEGIKFNIDIPQQKYDFDYSHIDELLGEQRNKKGGILKRTKKRKKKTNNKIISNKILYGYKAGGKV
jgi:hypothetical protein